MMAQGIIVAATTDGSAPQRPFDLLLAARGVREAHVARSQDRYLFPPGKLLEMITIDAATVMGMEREVGSLKVGKRADLVLIDTAKPHLTPWWMPVHCLVQQATGQDVDTVIVGGEVLLAGGVPTKVDTSEILSRAVETAHRHVEAGGLAEHMTDPGWGQIRRVFA